MKDGAIFYSSHHFHEVIFRGNVEENNETLHASNIINDGIYFLCVHAL